MEVGDFIAARQAELAAWGKYVVDAVAPHVSALLKVPATFRVKDIVSARAKQLRKGYSNPETQMTDLVGARFVVLTSNDLKPVQDCIREHSAWMCNATRDPAFEAIQDPTSFVYQSHHYEVRPGKPLPAGDVMIQPDICCEVQVRTLLQHAYAELTHDSFYKPDQTIPSQAERLVARSMALMETTDELLCRALKALNDANRPSVDLVARAYEITSALSSAEASSLVRSITGEFRDLIFPGSADDLHEFSKQKPYVLERIRARHGAGLFAFPAAVLLGYWVASQLEAEARVRWPLAGTHVEFGQILTDLGLAESVN